MIKNLWQILSLGCLILVSCDDPLKKERETLYKEVMAIHDEMMLEITPIRKGKTQLETMIKSAEQRTDTLAILKYKTAFDQLQKADDAMFGWMNQFSVPAEDVDHEKAIQYLKDQKVKVTEMQRVMKENMDAALPVVE